MESTLVLDASMEPLSIVPARRAIKLVMDCKAVSLDDSSKTVNSQHLTYPIPYVIKVVRLVTPEGLLSRRNGRIAFSKRGVFIRDNGKCVYCGNKATTIDHVFPRSRGGVDSYENCVACCEPCNSYKGSKLVEDLGWELPSLALRQLPGPHPHYHMLFRTKRNSPQWDSWKSHMDSWFYQSGIEDSHVNVQRKGLVTGSVITTSEVVANAISS